MGAKEIWMPTRSAAHMLRQEGSPGVSRCSPNSGELLSEVYEILDLIEHADIILGTGHISPAETAALAHAARKQGLRKILVTHPEAAFIRMPVDLQVSLARDGIYFERCYVDTTPLMHSTVSLSEIAHVIRTVGVDSTILSTDFGQADNPPPVDGMRAYLSALALAGFTPAEIHRMAGENPAVPPGSLNGRVMAIDISHDAPELNPAERERLLDLLRKMFLIRYFEQAAGLMYQKGMVKGGVHPYSGQEAVAVGVCACLRPTDLITSNHRGHGHHIAKGADINRLMAELLGKSSGYCAGRGGSMHVAAFEVGSLGAYPILASGVPIAVGAALSACLLQRDYVVVSFFGEGALAQGTLHEAMNMAVIWKLPVIFVCENNQYAVSTHVSQTIAFDGISTLADAYQIPGYDVDGQDIFAVIEAAARAVDRARQRGGPSLLHARTYRFEGHYFGEPQVYRSKEEIQEARQTIDPIQLMRARLIEKGLLTQPEAEAIEHYCAASRRGSSYIR